MQGFLADDESNPLTGARELRFPLYPTANASAAIFSESFAINTPTGAFTVVLGASSPIDLSTIPEGGSLWLGLSIDGGVELSPRLQFGTAPYAARCVAAEDAQTLEGLGVVDIASSPAEALATDDVYVQNTVDTVDGDFDVNGEVLFSSTSDKQRGVGAGGDRGRVLRRRAARRQRRDRPDPVKARRAARPTLVMYEADSSDQWSVGDGTTAGVQDGELREVLVTTGQCRREDDVPLGDGGQVDFGFSGPPSGRPASWPLRQVSATCPRPVREPSARFG